jgi:hypothetical protein
MTARAKKIQFFFSGKNMQRENKLPYTIYILVQNARQD